MSKESKPHENNPDDFQEFNLNQLQRYAKKWVKEYSVIQIKKITLHRFSLKYSPKKYALVFEYSGCQDPDAVDIGCQEFGLEPLESYPIEGEDPFITALKEIKHADQYADQGPHQLFDSSFFDVVYEKKPSMENSNINYFRNWIYCLKQHASSEDQLPRGILTDEPYWILYPVSGASEITETKPGPDVFIERKVFPCITETRWEIIEMALLPAGDKFMVKTPLGRGYYDHIELGLFNDRKNLQRHFLVGFLNHLKSYRKYCFVPSSLYHFISNIKYETLVTY